MKKYLWFVGLVGIIGCNDHFVDSSPEYGDYAGTISVELERGWQDTFSVVGTVRISFDDNDFTMTGVVSEPRNGIQYVISDAGTLYERGDVFVFNEERFQSLAMFTAWSLMGKFRVEENDQKMRLVQEIPGFRYEMNLNKK